MSAGKPECPGNTNGFWNSLADCGRPLHLREILWQTDGDWEKWLHIPHFNRDQCLVQGWKVWRSLSVANFQTRRTVLSAKRRSAFWKKSMRPESTGRKWPEMTGRKRSKETSWTRFTIINAFFVCKIAFCAPLGNLSNSAWKRPRFILDYSWAGRWTSSSCWWRWSICSGVRASLTSF